MYLIFYIKKVKNNFYWKGEKSKNVILQLYKIIIILKKKDLTSTVLNQFAIIFKSMTV